MSALRRTWPNILGNAYPVPRPGLLVPAGHQAFLHMHKENFTVVAHEPGFYAKGLPTWTDNGQEPLFDPAFNTAQVARVAVPQVPGGFMLHNVLSAAECQRIIEVAEGLGFHEDSPVSLPHEVRHNENMNWVVSQAVDGTIWQRSKHLVPEQWQGQTARGLNARFRFYKYKQGDFFDTHNDGAWPGSRVVNGQLVANAYADLYSQYTYLLFLSDDYEGGSTQFLVSKANPEQPARQQDDVNLVPVRTPKGGALCFPHGTHPLHCLHSSQEITRGIKYIIRTDILFG